MPRVHRNLHSLKPGSKALPWSYYQTSGEKVRGSFGCVLRQVTPKHPTGKAAEACRNGTGYRAVFAWLKCERLEVLSAEQMAQAYSPERISALLKAGAITRLRLNPKVDKYFHTITGAQASIYRGSKLAILMPDGRAYTSTEDIK